MTTFRYTISDKDYSVNTCDVDFHPVPLRATMIKSVDDIWVGDVLKLSDRKDMDWVPFRTVEGGSFRETFDKVLDIVDLEIKIWKHLIDKTRVDSVSDKIWRRDA